MIRDKILLYNNYGNLYIHCYSCKDPEHTITTCPYLFYRPNRNVIIGRYNLPQKLRRLKRRNPKRTKHAYRYFNGRVLNEKEMKQKLMHLQEQYKTYAEEEDEEKKMMQQLINEEEDLQTDEEIKIEDPTDSKVLTLSRKENSIQEYMNVVTDQEMFREESITKRSQADDWCKQSSLTVKRSKLTPHRLI